MDVYSKGSLIATHARKKHGEESLKVEHYIDVFRVKPGSFEGSKPLYQLRQEGVWPEVFDEIWGQLIRRDGKAKADKEMIEILALIRKFEIGEVAQAARLGSSCGILNASGIYQFAQKLKEPRTFSIDVGELNAFNRSAPNTDEYDILWLAWRN
ncbi:MAG: hypothetical protein IBX64_13005 [Actinobacteria bacterium]|nr:hypothetical protein [Actinomycetota bacterium]